MDELNALTKTEEHKTKLIMGKMKLLWITLFVLAISISSAASFYSGYNLGFSKTQKEKESQIAKLQTENKRLRISGMIDFSILVFFSSKTKIEICWRFVVKIGMIPRIFFAAKYNVWHLMDMGA